MNQKKHPIGRFFAVLGITLLCLLISLLGVIWVLERGPSPTVTGMFTRSVRETSAIRWISNIFLTEEELNEYKSVSTEDLETESVNTSLIHIEKAAEKRESGSDQTESVKLIDIAEGTCKGKLLIVSDPKQVILGTSDEFVKQPGLQLTDMVAKYDGLAGINAGGFNDENGTGSGGIPQGIVIVNGKVIFGNDLTPYHLVGLDRDGILHVGSMNGREAVENGIQWAVSFVTHDGLASSLIINCIVGTSDMMYERIVPFSNHMLEYGAVNAGNLDGGSSSVMVYDGEIVNHCASVTGPRRIPTGFIVLKEGVTYG